MMKGSYAMKRFLSLLLSCVLLFSFLGNVAYAQEEDSSTETQNIELLNDSDQKTVQLILSEDGSSYDEFNNLNRSFANIPSSIIEVNQTEVEEIYKTSTDENYFVLTEANTYVPVQCIEVDLTSENNIETIIEKYNLNEIRSNYLKEAQKKYAENPDSSSQLKMYIAKELENNISSNQRQSPVNPGYFHYSINGFRLIDDIYVQNDMWSTNMKISGINSSGTAKNLRTLIVTGVSTYLPEIALLNTGVSIFQNFFSTVTPNIIQQSYKDTVEVNLKYDKVDKFTFVDKDRNGSYYYGIRTSRVDLRTIQTSAYFFTSSGHVSEMKKVDTYKFPNIVLKSPNYDSAAEYSIRSGSTTYMPVENIFYKVANWNYFIF